MPLMHRTRRKMCPSEGMSAFVWESSVSSLTPLWSFWSTDAAKKASAASKLRTIFLVTYLFKLKSKRILLFWKYQVAFFFRLTSRKILIKIFLFWSKCWKHEKKQTETLVCKENKVNSINYIHILLVGERLALGNF